MIVATGPLTSEALAGEIEALLGFESLFFYDAVAPIVYRESIDMELAFRGSRYGKFGDDYINCPMDEDTYYNFVKELTGAEVTGMRDFEEARYFEGCLPIEVMAARGPDTLSFGPLKPVGLIDDRDKGEGGGAGAGRGPMRSSSSDARTRRIRSITWWVFRPALNTMNRRGSSL